MKLTKADRKALQANLDAQWEVSRDQKVKELIKSAVNFCNIELITENETGTPIVLYKFFNNDVSYGDATCLPLENCSKPQFDEVESFVARCQEHVEEKEKQQQLKMSALQKLTHEERVALGIKHF